ncbi:DUF3817 domain-containing protein [Janibacter alittae]|uniref:DUF3817 domain-containing protein n=1 Tax=Janibacter alittae TaxID=3115209 RepID=A0ABZ2MFS4_9MICO
MTLPSPRRLFMTVATAEAVTWSLLLIGMFLKYVTQTTELGVRIGGMLHGVVFIAYVLVTVIAWVDQQWPAKRGVIALATAIPPLATLWTERWLDRDGHLGTTWRLRTRGVAATAPEKLVSGALVRPGLAALALVAAVAVLTGAALFIGPPVPTS